jgi:hypothetical protein
MQELIGVACEYLFLPWTIDQRMADNSRIPRLRERTVLTVLCDGLRHPEALGVRFSTILIDSAESYRPRRTDITTVLNDVPGLKTFP